MAKGCKKCDPHELCEECPEWIFTLADLIMCMMGLFVLLWVLKPSGNPNPGTGNAASAGAMSNDRLNEVMAEIRTALDYTPSSTSTEAVDLEILYKKLVNLRGSRGGEGKPGDAQTKKEGADGIDSDVTTIRLGTQTAEGGPLLFPAGQATCSDDTQLRVIQLAKLIQGHRNIVMVRGHTSRDDLPDSATAEQKMDLSIRRAQAVADRLIAAHVEPDVLRVQGCSTFEPVKQRAYSNASQSVNRRVEVEVTATLVSEMQDSHK